MCVWHPAAGRGSRNALSAALYAACPRLPGLTPLFKPRTCASHVPENTAGTAHTTRGPKRKTRESGPPQQERKHTEAVPPQTATCGAHKTHILVRVIISLQPHELSMTQDTVTTSSRYVGRTKRERATHMAAVSITGLVRAKNYSRGT